MNDDTISLLGECNSGIKMAVASIDEVLPATESPKLRQQLVHCKQAHEDLGSQTHELLEHFGSDGKEPSPVARGMSWLKTNAKLTVHPGDSTVAELMIDGCHMGVKSLSRYQNQYPTADESAMEIASSLISLEEQLGSELRTYLS